AEAMQIAVSARAFRIKLLMVRKHMRIPHNSPISIVVLSLVMALSIACSHRTNDEKIAKDIQEKAASDPDTKDAQVTVEAKDGKVKLSGTVKNDETQKKLAEIATEEPGTTGLDDETKINPELSARGQLSSETT